ncbi:hypothetical protein ACWDUN_27305, partial [Mycobacterium sp. NPDC003323]
LVRCHVVVDSSLPGDRATESHNDWTTTTGSPHTEQAAIILRKQGNLAAEIALLERFLGACPNDRPQVSIAERLVNARAKLDRSK